MRQELYDVLQAISEAVKDEPAAGPGRVPPEDWEGWGTVLAVLGLTDVHRVMTLAREAVAQVHQHSVGTASAEQREGASENEDRLHDAEGRVHEDTMGNVPMDRGSRIVREIQMEPEGSLFEIWSPLHGGLSWVTEAILRVEFMSAAEPILAAWQASRAAASPREPANVREFDPAGARAILGGLGGPQLQTPPRVGSPLPHSARRSCGQPGSGRQQAGGEAAEPQADIHVPAGGRHYSPHVGSPSSGRRTEDGAASLHQGDRRLPQGPGDEPREHRPQPERAPPSHLDGRDPNSSYCDPEAAAALWKTFTTMFVRAGHRKRQRLHEQIVLARHSALWARRSAVPGREEHNAGMDLEEDDGFTQGAPSPHQQFGRRRPAAPGAAIGRAAPHVVGAGTATRAAGPPQRQDGSVEGAGKAPPSEAAQGGRSVHEEEDGVEEDEDEQGLAGGGEAAADDDGDDAHAGGGDAHRPQKRRRRAHGQDGAAGCRNSEERSGSPTQPQTACPQKQPQPGDVQQQAPSPARTDRTAESPTRWSSATSAGVTISNPESLWTPASSAAWESPAHTDVDADEPRFRQTGKPTRYHPAIIPDDRAVAAWKALGEMLRACRAARQARANDAAGSPRHGNPGAGLEQRAAARDADASPNEHRLFPAPDSPRPSGDDVRTAGGGAAEAARGATAPAGGGAASTDGAGGPPGGPAEAANDTGGGTASGLRPSPQLRQLPGTRGRRMPGSLIHRGLPETAPADGGTGALSNRGAGLVAPTQPLDLPVPGRRRCSQQQPVPAPSLSGASARSQGLDDMFVDAAPAPSASVTPSPAHGVEPFQAASQGSPAEAPAASPAPQKAAVVSSSDEAAAGQPMAADAGPFGCGIATQQPPAAACVDGTVPCASTSFEEPICGQRQSYDEPLGTPLDFAGGQATQLGAQDTGQSGAAAGGNAAPLEAAAAPEDSHQRVGTAPETRGAGAGCLLDEQLRGPVHDSQQALWEGERNGSPEHPLQMSTSQGIQTSQCLLDSYLLGMRAQGEPGRHTIAVQTSQAFAQAPAPQPPLPPLPPSQPRQNQQLANMGPAVAPPAALTESPPASPDEQPTGNQTVHACHVGTVVDVAVGHPEGQQRPGKPPRQGQNHHGVHGSCGPALAGASAAPAALTGSRVAGAQLHAQQLVPEGGVASSGAAGGDGTSTQAGPGGQSSGDPGGAVSGAVAEAAAAPEAVDVTPASAREPAQAAVSAQAAMATAERPSQQSDASGHSRAAVPLYGRLVSRGVPLEDVRAWMGPGHGALVVPSLTRDSLDVLNAAVGITSWPDVAMAVLTQLHGRNLPLPPAEQRPAVDRRIAGCAHGHWQDYWLAPQVPSSVHYAEELEGLLPMARDVLGGPPPLDGQVVPPAAAVASLEEAMRCLAGPSACIGTAVHQVGDTAGTAGQPEQAGLAGAASEAVVQAVADQRPGNQQTQGSNAGAAAQPATGGSVAEAAVDPTAMDGGDAKLRNEEQQQQVAPEGLQAGAGLLTQDYEFAVMSAPPDFFTQPFTQPF